MHGNALPVPGSALTGAVGETQRGHVPAEPASGLAARWFLSASQRGNPDTGIDSRHADGLSWTTGNSVRPLIHGSTYFRALREAVDRSGDGDLLLFTDWRGDQDEHLDEDGAQVGSTIAAAALRGATVCGLLWRSHATMQFSSVKNRGLGKLVEDAGGQVLMDMRIPKFGSHHQKLVVVRYRTQPDEDVAFVGGIDLCYGRRDDADHLGDPQALAMAREYGSNPPWHDIQLMIQGPAVGDVEAVFRERWHDPSPLARHPVHVVSSWIKREQRSAPPLPPQNLDPGPRGGAAVQLLRTYAVRHPGYPFARNGERSIARGYIKALASARSLVYVEDQYLWSREVAAVYAAAMRRNRDLRVVFIIPGYPEKDGRMSMPPNRVGRAGALDVLRDSGGDRLAIYYLENAAGTPIYVHAKACIIDDEWACIGSDNTNRRSWTHDSELSAAFVDEDGSVRELRRELAAEHLDCAALHLDDPLAFFDAFRDSAADLDRWHAGGRNGARPSGRLRVFAEDRPPARTRLWAAPSYRIVYDPDGRTRRMRRAGGF